MSYKNLIRKVFVPMLALSLMPYGNTVSADMRGVLTNPAQTVIVGDSRTEGMYETVGDSGVLWEYKSGMGYNWMVNDAVPEIDPYVGNGTSVVIMLGVNDIGDSWMADQYAAFLNSKAAEWKGRGAKVYYIAVTKCADNYSDRWGTDNSHIAEWNERIRPQLSTDVIYLDISSILGEVETVDGLHYTNTTNQQIYNIVMNYVESARYSDMIGTLGTGAFIIDQSENVPGVTGNGEMNEDGSIAGVTGSNENDAVDGVIGSNPDDEDKKEDSSAPDSSEVQTLIPEVLEHSEDIDQESVHPGVTGNNDNLLEEWFEEHPIEFGSESVVEAVIPEEDYGELPPLDNEENANKIDEESKDTTESDFNTVFEDGGWTDIEKDNDAEQNREGTATEENPVEERNIGSFADSLVENVVEEPILIPEDSTDSVAESMIEEPEDPTSSEREEAENVNSEVAESSVSADPEDPSIPEYFENTDSELTIPEQDENAEPVSPENVKESADEAKDRADREIREGGTISNVDEDKFDVNGAMLAPGSVTAADTEARDATPTVTGWNEEDTGKVYYADDGTLVTGREQIDGDWYLFDGKGVLEQEGIRESDGSLYYVTADGSLFEGWKEVDGKKYLFLPGGRAAKGMTDYEGSRYFFSDDGILLTGFFESDNIHYVSDEKGKLCTGWLEIDGNRYYCIDGVACTGRTLIDGRTYVFDENGVLQTGESNEDQDFLTDDNGAPLSGWQYTEEGTKYTDANGFYLHGWNRIGGETYWFDENGNTVSGIRAINGRNWVFSNNGVLTGSINAKAAFDDPTIHFVDLINKNYNLEAEYTGACNKGDLFDASKVNVYISTGSGSKTLVQNFTVGDAMTNPGVLDSDVMLNVNTEYGTAQLIITPESVLGEEAKEIDAQKTYTISAVYDGKVYEGDRIRASRIKVTAESQGGNIEEVQDFSVSDTSEPIFESKTVTITTEYGNTELTIDPVTIDYVEPDIMGFQYEGSSIDPENLIFGYSDGTYRRVSADEAEFGIAPSSKVLAEGKNEFPLLWEGREYVMTLTALKQDAFLLPQEATASQSQGFVGGNSLDAIYGPSDTTGLVLESLGTWHLTAYADTPEDQGPYVGQTASGAPLTAGRTVAVSAATMARRGLSFGDRLLINGHIYTIEDHGGSAMHDKDWADIFVTDPSTEYDNRFNGYAEVYLVR